MVKKSLFWADQIAREVAANITLNDINWETQSILIRQGKGGKQTAGKNPG